MKTEKIKSGLTGGDIAAGVLILIGSIFTIVGIILACNINQLKASGSGNTEMLPVVFTAIGLVILGIGAAFAFFSLRKRSIIRQVVQNGEFVMADVMSIRQNYSLEVNGNSPYVLECHYRDPVTGTLHIFTSRNLFYYPAELAGCQVRVYIDPENMNHYYVDVEDTLSGVQLH